MTSLLEHLETRRAGGRKLLVPYVMAGAPERSVFPDALRAAERFADAVEVGLPFSDPLMDGPVIAAAGDRVIKAGIGPIDALDLAQEVDATVPRLAMTYYNPIHRTGEVEFCKRAAKSGFSGLIVPDLPLEESETLRAAAAAEGIAWVPLVAPTSSPERVAAIVATATGFVYAVSTLGVTGARHELSERAAIVVERCRAATDLPVLIGIGVSNAEQAQAAVESADGVVIGSALVQILMDDHIEKATDFLKTIRQALDPRI